MLRPSPNHGTLRLPNDDDVRCMHIIIILNHISYIWVHTHYKPSSITYKLSNISPSRSSLFTVPSSWCLLLCFDDFVEVLCGV